MNSLRQEEIRGAPARTVLWVFMLLLLEPYPGGTVRAQWTRTNWPISKTIHAVMVSDSELYGGSTPGILKSVDDGASWTYPDSAFKYRAAYSFAKWNDLLFAGTDKGVYRSADKGRTWEHVVDGLVWPDVNIYGIALVDSLVFISTGGQGIYMSTDSGAFWHHPPVGFDGDGILNQLDSYLFAEANSTIYRSIDTGLTWQRSDEGLPINSVCVIEKVGTTYLALTMRGIYESSDSGATWAARQTIGLSTPGCQSLAGFRGDLYLGTTSGVYVSRDSGYSWTNISAGLDSVLHNVWIVTVKGEYLFAAVYGLGLWRRPLSELNTVESSVETRPILHSLGQNYPNPFNPSTTIRYGLPSRSHVTLTVFNTLGQQVAILQNGEQDAGYHEVKFDGANLPSGVYLYRMHAGSFVEVKKLILLR